MSEQGTDVIQETESFEAFECVAEALEYLDSYDAAKKNVEVLQQAKERLHEALADGNDPGYMKARYFRAMVHYLEGNPRAAITQFEQMGRMTLDSAFGKELSYNIAAAYNAAGEWEAAIPKFGDVIKNTHYSPEESTNYNSELRLLARAGLAFSYAGQFERLEGARPQELRSSGKRDEERIKEYSRMIEEQYQFAKDDARKVVDRDTVKESEQIFREAYTIVEGQNADRIVELLPAEAPTTKRRSSTRKIIIIVAGIVIFLVLIFFMYVELFVGWDHLFTSPPAS
jgi:tetratricopeptide (TPR) repeat protein